MRSKRFEVLDARPVNQDGFVAEWPEVGLIAMDGPNDPKPSIRIENGEIVELDGRQRADFDMLDTFIAATRFMAGEPARPWWHYTAERKARQAASKD